MLPERYRFATKADFFKTKRLGHTLSRPFFLATYLEDGRGGADSGLSSPLFGFTVTRRSFKKAVERNLVKRRLSAAVQEFLKKNGRRLPPGTVRVSFLARPTLLKSAYAEMAAAVNQVLSEIFKL